MKGADKGGGKRIAAPDSKALELKIKARELEEQAEKAAKEKGGGKK